MNKKVSKDKIVESSVPEQIEAFQTLRKRLADGGLESEIDISKPLDTCFPKKDNEYIRLLEKYMYDKDLQKLIMLCIIDDKREKEREYVYKGRYPEGRDPLMKLYHDLTARAIAVEYRTKVANNKGGKKE